MQDVMVDLETLGTVPGCSILSIGAVAFDEFDVLEEDGFYTAVSSKSCQEAGLHEDEETKKWWSNQSEAARKVLDDAGRVGTPSLITALTALGHFIDKFNNARVWGNGADFDNPIIAVAARAVGLQPKKLWKPYNGRCYRTVKNQYPDIRMVRSVGTYHNALDDSINQARHLQQICSQRGWKLA